MTKQRNLVAKHSRQFNKSHVMTDRKRRPSVDTASTKVTPGNKDEGAHGDARQQD